MKQVIFYSLLFISLSACWSDEKTGATEQPTVQELQSKLEKEKQKNKERVQANLHRTVVFETDMEKLALGGFKSGGILVTNNSGYRLEKAEMEYDIILSNGTIFSTTKMKIGNLADKQKRRIETEKSKRGTDIVCRLVYCKVPELDLEYNLK